MSHFTKSAFVGVCLPLLLASCQLSEPEAIVSKSSAPTDIVRFSSDASARAGAATQKYIITLKEDANLAALLPTESGDYDGRLANMRALLDRLIGTGIAQRAEQVYVAALKGFAITLTPQEVAVIQKLPIVESVEPDQMVQLKLPQTGGVTAQAQETPWGITRIGGAVNYTGSGVAWVIDTGIDMDHPDLNVSQTRGRNFIRSGASPDDDNGHGSHVAGTIAAKDNGLGVIGVAAGATVIPVKVLASNGSGTNSGVIAGIDFVASNGRAGDVANMSLGGGISTTLDNAVSRAATKGIKFALAAGNESQNANNSSPGRVNGSNIYTVSAFDINNYFASFSNYGNPPIDVSAPGVSIKSTYKNGAYATLSGTSMATPHVAGILLANGGTLRYNGYVSGDPDGNPDKRAYR